MDTSSEIKFLKAKVALLETEKKHLIQKVSDLEKKKSVVPRNILSSTIKVPIIPEDNQSGFPYSAINTQQTRCFVGQASLDLTVHSE